MSKYLAKILFHLLDNLKSFILPFLIAIYPSIYLYSINSSILRITSLYRMVIFNTSIAVIIYLVILIINKGQSTRSAIGAFILLVFFNLYGVLYNYFRQVDIFLVEHYIFLPLDIFLSIYAAWFLNKVRKPIANQIWSILVVVFGGLVIFNLVQIIPAEIERNIEPKNNPSIVTKQTNSPEHSYPDVYYFIFDEYSGFEPMREYWHNFDVDEFKEFLESKGFFVAEKSHGSSIDTINQLAIRLNYQDFPLNKEDIPTWFHDVANNRVMSYFKTKGYTIVAFDELKFGYPSAESKNADYLFEYSQGDYSDIGMLFDEYGMMVADNTMLYAFSEFYKVNNPTIEQHRKMIFFTLNRVKNLSDIPSPKFVFVHLLLPHFPFIFDENGLLNDPNYYHNWNYYLGHYKYTTSLITKTVNGILENADPENLPIIILQSDHGARNQDVDDPNSVILKDFPEEYKTSILFAIFIPGYDTANLTQDIDPINTFPIVFNHLFNENIPIK